ncbi:hypothetical protein WALSEDRAFT_68740 [Wallemia mellicola CBS 633.66]|uniref:Cysteine protease n=2 Tax=Wallemia mellicola TaxID=1708541 RepID=I4YCY0_WALMC|nr:hypothetical protein WALSEDRAFT_68740 [Wallemia mellicola CBS 633.66]EIM21822.1 hypothetical protein WALSEDRAFT_68740 [Wallemia mellicola CBS 633.66]TIC04529.1 hypothetical protein E3Q16_02653 [Wallemia mellicola]TIC63970.1 hypothetical protein E3Q02_02776 [Wallemia mellicola]|eukprot:XP_006958124.1 hypothetical protein WALSEDRAFT_68740 [Wallemia mellicola CBS 633.66]
MSSADLGEDSKLTTKLSSWVNNSIRRHSTIDRTLHYFLDYPGYQGTSIDDVSWILGNLYDNNSDLLDDFQSRIWCTYRSNFCQISLNDPMMDDLGLAKMQTLSSKPSHWLLRERTFNTDQGWGCMLRTSQSLLANTLQIMLLGRQWRRNPFVDLTDYAKRKEYVNLIKLLNLFMDNPSTLSPFSVHRMAVVGKSLGKEVGEWFGPSTAALAIKHLVNNQTDINLSVSVASDSVIYKSDVYQASGGTSTTADSEWGNKPVLILVGVRLGLDGIHPRYYETLKAFLRMQSCVGIAGGRPSSSYYFFGYQSDSLFYVDPHIMKPTINIKTPPTEGELKTEIENLLRCNSLSSSSTTTTTSNEGNNNGTPIKQSKHGHRRRKTSTILNNVTSKNRRRSSSSATLNQISPDVSSPSSSIDESQSIQSSWMKPNHYPSSSSHSIPQTIPESNSFIKDIPTVDELNDKWYIDNYNSASISTYFCDKPRKMNISQMDPSMLIGFLVKDENEFFEFVNQIKELPQQVFSVADSHRSYEEDDSDNDMQSLSSSSSNNNSSNSINNNNNDEWVETTRKDSQDTIEDEAIQVDKLNLTDEEDEMTSLEDCLIDER